MRKSTSTPHSQSTKILLAFAAVYVIWGSTYLGIRFAIETIPPFLMAGARFFIAGAVLFLWLRLRGVPGPTARQWRSMAIIGFLLIGAGNGAVSWAEQTLPSGLTALIIALIPLWFVTIEWFQNAIRPTLEVVLGLALGLIGMIVLIDPARITDSGHPDLIGTAVVVSGTIAWALGSMYSRKAEHPSRPLLGTAMQMLTGGALLLVVSVVTGEAASFDIRSVSAFSLAALGYLIVFGSLIAFTSYIWLLKATTPARVATYAYVNPVIAVFLGWLLADELLNARIIIAAAIIVAAVALITAVKIRQATR
ncbi:MAG: drug/metabolite exporter YedA [Bacteroidetes bacterium]|nr:drug/metabolite exporter YedA [Bacteroidota bacterium]